MIVVLLFALLVAFEQEDSRRPANQQAVAMAAQQIRESSMGVP